MILNENSKPPVIKGIKNAKLVSLREQIENL